MKKNMEIIDRVIRIVVALGFVGLYFTSVVSGTFANVLFALAGVITLTSLVGFCPLYWPFGINSWKKNKS
jgi:hypothetical protein